MKKMSEAFIDTACTVNEKVFTIPGMVDKITRLENRWKHDSPLTKYSKLHHTLNTCGSGKPYLVEWALDCTVDVVNAGQMHPSVFAILNISPKAGGKGIVHLFLARRNIKQWWFSFLDNTRTTHGQWRRSSCAWLPTHLTAPC